ncbi:beta-carotene 15,15'-dioxygenase, Brp/Blh family [Pantoea sp. Mb-10]|uniref:beta-carotene 15,15'-dioxygenase, Brp/Blh family n=1 Tax=unclassified Pantoea TaxID=2630326 RepID=UPI001E5911AE|nr:MULTISPECIES: beta-carotene 15,15'-dioxygenase, Brp/Blh family [unclassified Pantoea]MCE0491912.1 beta-carotene 15,15'-dioxygenase, Brp/Blh family [Pantoea sp. Mb-10]MCE0503350.1 beta-carotene 15,15'-dioxygenase, Brp/Blh family [Pantoea sp. Pb-8]
MMRPQRHAAQLLLAAAALAAAVSPLVVQLVFAVVAIGGIGMAHGASDLAIVQPHKQRLFLACYGLAIVLCLVWWHQSPAWALPGFLIASALHFGWEDAPDGPLLERIGRGISLIATPAVCYHSEYRAILSAAGLAPAARDLLTTTLAAAGAVAASGLLIMGAVRGNKSLLAGTAALLLLPPFVGFSTGFLLLHALPQTEQRRRQLGCASYAEYLRATWPVLMAAIALAAMAAWITLPAGSGEVRPLFAALAALAIPHLLVTPWFAPTLAPPPGGTR